MAQKLKFGNGTWATKKGSTLAYNDEGGNYKPLPFTTTRDSIATRVNKEGLIEVVGNDIPRIDYTDSADGVLLLEPSRTNLLAQSNQFDTNWVNASSNETESGIGFGGLNYWTINKTAAYGHIKQALSASGTLTLSVYAKKGNLNWMRIIATGGSSTPSTWFDLENGEVGTANFFTEDAKIDFVGNGWYRCSITIDVGTINGVRFYPSKGNNDVTGTSGNINIQAAQLEAGSYPTSYIPTSGSTVTRQADTATGAGNDVVFNDSEGVLFAELSLINDSGVSNNITLGDGTSSTNRMMLLFSNGITNRISARFDSSASDITLNADGYNLTLNHKVVLKYKANDIAIWVDGFEIDSGNSFSAPSLLNRIDFYNPFGGGQNNFYGKTKEIGYYDSALTDEELEYLTSYRSLNELVTELNLNTL